MGVDQATRFRLTTLRRNSALPVRPRWCATVYASGRRCLSAAVAAAIRNESIRREFSQKLIALRRIVMTRSVEDIRRESELARAQFSATVGQLRNRISETTDDIRYRVSPE